MYTLRDERACAKFIDHLLGLTNWVEDYANRLGDEAHDFTSDSLMRLHFNTVKHTIEAFLADPQLTDAFCEIYPQRRALVDAGHALCASFDRLHTVRMDLITQHRDGARSDVHCHKDALTPHYDMISSDRELAALYGITKEQFDAWKAQCNEHGYVHLSRTERATLRAAILAEFQ
jgi:hypothetical protein